MAFYLTYRPQKIADLDLPEIRDGLARVLAKKNPPHAYLFTGPRGAGKTSAARILAKSFNCLKNKGVGDPCGKCAVCQEIAAGSFIDLIEIDGASNRGIDDVRSLKENIRLVPGKGRAKVYIIDEVHMLTTEAFNALLKTLEEPPVHAYFILCTTEPEKVPETIASRCVEFHFRKAKPAEIENSLKKVIKGEGLVIDPEALGLLARSVDGSFRDAQKVLDQLSSTKEIGLKEIRAALGQGSGFSGEALIHYLAEGTLAETLTKIGELVEEGVSFRQFSKDVLEALRALLLQKVGVGKHSELAAVRLEIGEVKQLLRLFSIASREVKGSLIEQLPLEIAVVEWFQSRDQSHNVGEQVSVTANEPNREKSSQSQLKKSASPEPVKSVQQPSGNGKRNGHLTLEAVVERWDDLLEEVRPMNHSVSALLRACRPKMVDGEMLTLEVFYPFHKERLETEKCREIIETAASSIFGLSIKIRCVLGQKGADSVAPARVEDVLIAEAEKIFS